MNPDERKFSTYLTIGAATVFFLLGGFIGVFLHGPDSSPQTEFIVKSPERSLVYNAQQYADWCGGYVQVIDNDVMVLGCDR